MNQRLRQRLICVAVRERAAGDAELARLLLAVASAPRQAPPPKESAPTTADALLGRTLEVITKELFR